MRTKSSGGWYGVLDALWGLKSMWKPPNPGVVPQNSALAMLIRATQPEIRLFFRFGPIWPAAAQNAL